MINRIIDFSVRNTLLVLLLVGAAALAGAHALRSVPLDAIPDLGDTQVIVYSRWERSPDLIEAQVTYPIVTAMLGAPRVRAVRGFSDFGYSFVYVIRASLLRERLMAALSGFFGAGHSTDGIVTISVIWHLILLLQRQLESHRRSEWPARQERIHNASAALARRSASVRIV